ncbi:hypothetical protein HU230_0011655 [Bradyrhizobium quebecense]|uniref:Uncharacterized protein n=1 Tax=Bradyrhizobium quebecense TaxID=2748629 RepID=A0A973WTN8_9BRAD|nr:hypothetical protein [Bradyrhizobium quebecense]UGA46649.1 hypothetical protein HU230_0011655 [Bradyrhizobium quebecense]
MSIADLKVRMSDIPGIETLTMRLEAGRILLSWGAYTAAVDASASDNEIEAAIRNAIKLPPVSLIPDKPAPVASPAAPQEQAAMSASNPASVGQTVKAMMDEHVKLMGQIHAAQLEILRSNLADQRQTVATGVGAVANTIAAQTDEFKSIMGQYANNLGGE